MKFYAAAYWTWRRYECRVNIVWRSTVIALLFIQHHHQVCTLMRPTLWFLIKYLQNWWHQPHWESVRSSYTWKNSLWRRSWCYVVRTTVFEADWRLQRPENLAGEVKNQHQPPVCRFTSAQASGSNGEPTASCLIAAGNSMTQVDTFESNPPLLKTPELYLRPNNTRSHSVGLFVTSD